MSPDPNLFESVDLRVQVFGSAPEFLQRKLPDVPSCLVLDIRLPGPSGLHFQAELAKAGIQIPIIFDDGEGHESGGHRVSCEAIS